MSNPLSISGVRARLGEQRREVERVRRRTREGGTKFSIAEIAQDHVILPGGHLSIAGPRATPVAGPAVVAGQCTVTIREFLGHNHRSL